MKTDLQTLLGVALATTFGLTGCPADDSGAEGSADGSTSAATAGTDNPTAPTTTMPTGAMTDSASQTSTPTATMSTSATMSTTDPMPTTDTGVDPLPDGEMCMSNEECESGMCFLAGILGGLCGQCLTEEDCEFGCNIPNPLAMPPVGAMCNEGGLGEGCNTNDACADASHTCAVILDVPGVLSASTCSECETTADCMAPMVCNVAISVADISGEKTCVPVGSVANGEFCDLEGDGAMACENFCGSADIMGLIQFGVCSDCSNAVMDNEGCGMMEVCEDPTVDLDGGVVAGACVPAP